MSGNTNGLRLLDSLFERPITSVRMAEELLGCSYVTAANVIGQLEHLGILNEITGRQRNRIFRYAPYLDVFDRQALATPAAEENPAEVRTTIS